MNEQQQSTLALPWQAPSWARMASALNQERVAHGLLIAGTPGVGKRCFAERVMAALLCRDRQPNADACGMCSGCRQRQADTHPDYSRLVPEEKGKTIKVDQVRQFSRTLHLTAQYATGRVGWIDPAESLSSSAANSLLKTLEEPPAGCHILLISDQVSALLPTIRSRCQIWHMPAADPETGRYWLEQQQLPVPRDPDQLRTPMMGLSRPQEETEALIDTWDADLARLLGRRLDPISAAENAHEADRRLWVDWLHRRGNDLLQAALDHPPDTMSQSLAQAAQRLGSRRLADWSRKISAIARIMDSNVDWRLTVESLYIDLSKQVVDARRSRGA